MAVGEPMPAGIGDPMGAGTPVGFRGSMTRMGGSETVEAVGDRYGSTGCCCCDGG